jgi:hypothetical protein
MSLTKVVEIGLDGMCKCSGGDTCPLGKMGMESRCTERWLVSRGIQVTHPDGWQCEFCLTTVDKPDEVNDELHLKFGDIRLCQFCKDTHRNNLR